MARNTADENQIKRDTEKARFTREREVNDLRKILAIPEGRRFIWRYIGISGVFKLSFTGNSETFFNEGQRNVGLKLIADVMEANPESYLQMTKEAEEEEKKTNV